MFISEELAEKRVRDSENLLNRIRKNDRESSVPPAPEPPAIVPEVLIDPEDYTCESAPDVPSPAVLKAMLNERRKTGLSTEAQASAALLGVLVGKAAAGKAFDIGRSHVDDLITGHTSQKYRRHEVAHKDGTFQKDALVEELLNQQKAVRDLAFEKIEKTLGVMTDVMLKSIVDPVKASTVARNLSQVLDKVTPKEQHIEGGVHFHVWRPEMAEVGDYKMVTVGGQE